jgi:L-threonylcarbamoyladenylate synthase
MNESGVTVWQWGESVECLRELVARGGILAFPTESSYGLGVDPLNVAAVEAVFKLKGRPAGKPLPVVLGGVEQLAGLGGDPTEPQLQKLAAAWPAPLTVIVPLTRPIPAAPAGRLGIRIPGHPRLRKLLQELGGPLTATSANLSGEAPILDPEPLVDMLEGRDSAVVDGGKLPGGRPSTVVELEPAGLTILRRGSYPVERLSGLAPDLAVRWHFSARPAEMSADGSN